ncbi:MAG: ABC transporter substrate-binding protein [Spirochaetaceae bacterium]|jgi:iron complex transport system substrate-binding protein|nr:ABC transporter substrate-binding protein [Spirochaetaceae bacterium]
MCALFFVFVSAGLYPAGARQSRTVQPVSGKRTFTDSVARRVEIPAELSRISASGSLAQMFLIAVAPDLLCTVTARFPADQAEFMPSGLAELPVIGQFYGAANLNLEAVAEIAPEIVIDVGELKDTIAADMDGVTKATAVPAVHITADLLSTPRAFRVLGNLLGREAQGEALAAFCEKSLETAKRIMTQVGENRKTVLYCLGKQGMNVLAAGTFHAEILDWLTDNQAVVSNPAARGSGNETNMEQLLIWNPEVIFFESKDVYASAESDPVWRQMRAVQNRRYYTVPQKPYNWIGSPPSINRYIGMLWMLKVLYPEYADFDLYAETAEYYRLFYGYALSREEFDSLTETSLGGSR